MRNGTSLRSLLAFSLVIGHASALWPAPTDESEEYVVCDERYLEQDYVQDLGKDSGDIIYENSELSWESKYGLVETDTTDGRYASFHSVKNRSGDVVSFDWPEGGIIVTFQRALPADAIAFQVDRGSESDFSEDSASTINFRNERHQATAFKRRDSGVRGAQICRIERTDGVVEVTGARVVIEYEGELVHGISVETVPEEMLVVVSNKVLGIDDPGTQVYESFAGLTEAGFMLNLEDIQGLKRLFGPDVGIHDFVVIDTELLIPRGASCVKGVTPVMIFDSQGSLSMVGSLSFG